MTKFGQVASAQPENQTVTVRYARPDACEKCGACGGKTHEQAITLKGEAQVGDWVKVELPDGRFLNATAIAYLIPLACFLAGLFAGYLLSGQNELVAFAASLTGLGLSLLILKLADRRIAGKPEWTPRITAVYRQKPDMADIGCHGQGDA